MEYSAVSTIWIMVGTVLIFFMQAGFAMLETGMTRVKMQEYRHEESG